MIQNANQHRVPEVVPVCLCHKVESDRFFGSGWSRHRNAEAARLFLHFAFSQIHRDCICVWHRILLQSTFCICESNEKHIKIRSRKLPRYVVRINIPYHIYAWQHKDKDESSVLAYQACCIGKALLPDGLLKPTQTNIGYRGLESDAAPLEASVQTSY